MERGQDRYRLIVEQIQQTKSSIEACKLITNNVGNMAQVRADGNGLRQAGIVIALVTRIHMALKICRGSQNEKELDMFECGVKAVGALRDLGCGCATSRRAVRECPGGLEGIVGFISRVHGVQWIELTQNDLRGLTAAAGAIRNLAHSTQENCTAFHQLGVTEMLSWRLLSFTGCTDKNENALEFRSVESLLPDAKSPWREAAYRSAGSIINIAEKCKPCVDLCASNKVLVDILIESWGGKDKSGRAAFIHPGLHLILMNVVFLSEKSRCVFGIDPTLLFILDREERRRRNAQEAEERRKQKLLD